MLAIVILATKPSSLTWDLLSKASGGELRWLPLQADQVITEKCADYLVAVSSQAA